MTADKKKGPTAFETYKAKRKAIDKLVDTIYIHHHEAYTSAAQKHLKDEKGLIDYSKLEDVATQDKFAQEMTDFYVEKAKSYFGIGKDKELDEQQIEMLLMAYSGVTKTELFTLARKYGEDFTLPAYKQTIDDVQKSLMKKLTPLTTAHVKDEHKGEIIQEMGLEDRIDSAKITTEELSALMHEYHNKGGMLDPRLYKKAIYRKEPAGHGAPAHGGGHGGGAAPGHGHH